MSSRPRLGFGLAVLLTLGAVACGADTSVVDEEDIEDSEDAVVARTSSGGTLDGQRIKFEEAAADSLQRIRSGGRVSISASRLELSSGRQTCTEWKKNAHGLRLSFQNNDGDTAPGTVFRLGTSETSSKFASARYSKSGDDCSRAGEEIVATSGLITITKATSRNIKGQYEFRFGNHGTLRGTFEAPTCLKSRDYGTGAVPACRE